MKLQRNLQAAVLGIIFCLLLPMYSAAADKHTIGMITVKGLYSADRTELLGMMDLREGATIDAQKVQTGIKRAFLKGIFEDISVETNDQEPAAVTVTVRERDIIGKISFQGDYAVSLKRLRSFIMIKDGDVVRTDLVAAAERSLRENLLLAGYPNAVVHISWERMKEPYRIEMIIAVDTGTPLTITEIFVKGTDVVTRDDLKLSVGDVYDQLRIREELERIRSLLRKDGYYHPEAGPYEYDNGTLTISVRPGNRLTLVIEGNNAISTKQLMKEAPFFELEAVNDEVIDEAVMRMTSLYHREGYSMAQIAPVVRTDKNTTEITFFVFEGQKIKIRTIQVSGSSLSAQSVKNIMALKEGEYFNPDIMETDRDTLQEFYRALGYLESSVHEIDDTIHAKEGFVDLSVSIEEGDRTLITSISVDGIPAETHAKLLSVISLKIGDPYNEVDISDARFRIIDAYVSSGNLNVDVEVHRSIEDHKAALVFQVVEGAKVVIGKVIVTGNQKTRYEVLRREVVQDEGRPYSFRAMAEERRKLYKLGLFDSVDIEPYNAADGVKDLVVRVQEGNAGAYEFGIGYADYEQFRGYAEVSYRNLWGMNRQGLLRAELSSLQERFLAQYTEPWFWGHPLPFRVLFLYEDKKEITVPERQVRYRIERYSASAGIEKQLTETLKSDLYYEFSIVRTSDVQPDVVLSKEDVGTLAISSIRPSLVYDTRDNPFEPTRGMVAGISAKIASSVLFSETNFIKTTLYASYFQRLNKRLILALSARGGIAYGYSGTHELPIVERFFLGGRFSVRGYEQDTLGPRGVDNNPTGGNAFAMGSVELRTYVGRGVSIVPFFDFGNVWQRVADFRVSDIRYTAGLGLRYGTPVGPLRVDYGHKLNKDKDENSGELHFSIGHAF